MFRVSDIHYGLVNVWISVKIVNNDGSITA